jgi:hypothetical protein
LHSEIVINTNLIFVIIRCYRVPNLCSSDISLSEIRIKKNSLKILLFFEVKTIYKNYLKLILSRKKSDSSCNLYQYTQVQQNGKIYYRIYKKTDSTNSDCDALCTTYTKCSDYIFDSASKNCELLSDDPLAKIGVRSEK